MWKARENSGKQRALLKFNLRFNSINSKTLANSL